MTARQWLHALERRIYSNSWDIPDAVLPELVRKLTPRLRALLGDLDREIASDSVFTLVAARVPGVSG
jgi:hypothetical protein